MNKTELETLIKTAFKDVTLDGGISLHQAAVIDNYGEGVTAEEFAALPTQEITNDWTAITDEIIEEFCRITSHLDAKGFRYYIPALVLGSLNELFEVAQWTSYALCPELGNLWEHKMMHYSLLNQEQRSAIAQFLCWFPQLHNDSWDNEFFDNALKNYWHQFL